MSVSIVATTVGAIAKEIVSGIDGVFTSDEERARAELEMQRVLMQPQIIQGMTTLKEAEHPDWRVAGWRPALGWMAVLGLAWEYIGRPMWSTLFQLVAIFSPENSPAAIQAMGALPHLDQAQLMALVGVLLGAAGIRTFEKLKGVARG